MKLYKLTEQDDTTYYGVCRWGVGVTHIVKAKKRSRQLCTSGVIHAYEDANLALLLNPMHADIQNPLLWEAEGDVVACTWDKCGVWKLTTNKLLPLPEWFADVKKRECVLALFAVFCAEAVLPIFENVYPDNKGPRKAVEDAKRRLVKKLPGGKSFKHTCDASCGVARGVTGAYFAADAARYAVYAVDAAACASYDAAHYYTAGHAAVAANSAYTATSFVRDMPKINFVELAKRAIQIVMNKEVTDHGA